MTHSPGVPNTAFQRLLPPDYSDDKSLPRGGLAPSSLPSPRAVSVAVHQAHQAGQDILSKMQKMDFLMWLGQFSSPKSQESFPTKYSTLLQGDQSQGVHQSDGDAGDDDVDDNDGC